MFSSPGFFSKTRIRDGEKNRDRAVFRVRVRLPLFIQWRKVDGCFPFTPEM